MTRNTYSMPLRAYIIGQIGRLQTIKVIPVRAGDSLEVTIDGVFRLATTRKEITSECQVDICAFYVPHRHVYGQDWINGLVNGGLPGINAWGNVPAGIATNSDSRNPFYLGIHTCGATINRTLPVGYNQIYQRYFAVPSTNTNGTWNFANTSFYPNGSTSDLVNTRLYGARAARLPHILNGGTNLQGTSNIMGFTRSYTDAQWGLGIPQDTPSLGTAQLDIRRLDQLKTQYSRYQDMNYWQATYDDILEGQYSTNGVNSDADQRPTYLGRMTSYVSGQDVNGTDDATLGSFVGKTVDRLSFHLPRRFMPEHGNVWLMMLPRYPLIHTREQDPLLATAQPTFKLIAGQAETWEQEPVVPFDPGKWIAGGSAYTPNIELIQEPFGQEYRYLTNRVHPAFEQIPGYPVIAWDTANAQSWYYYQDNEYTETFQVSQMQHWQAYANVSVMKYTDIPDVVTSIHAGGN